MDNGGRFIRETRIFNARHTNVRFRELVEKEVAAIPGAQVKHFECNEGTLDETTSARIQLVRQDQQQDLIDRLKKRPFVNGYVDPVQQKRTSRD